MSLRFRPSFFAVLLAACGSRSALDRLDAVGDAPAAAGGAPAARGGATSASGSAPGAGAGTSSAASASSGGFGGSASTGASSGVAGMAEAGNTSGESGEGGAGGQRVVEPGRAIEVALGRLHSCARFDDGRVRCWGAAPWSGNGSAGTIGDDEPASFAGDLALGDGGDVAQLAAGWFHTCARLDSGKLRCWGSSIRGQLGYGNDETIGDDETPASAGDLNVGGIVAHVSAGYHHTCASLTDGSVRCWGHNNWGQLGYANRELVIGDDETPAEAPPLEVGGFVLQVAAGNGFTCARLVGGKVRCWGAGEVGLGYGNSESIGDDETPAEAGDIDLGGKAVQIAAGFAHVCALLDTGHVRCWGKGTQGALGYGNTEDVGDDETPAEAGDVHVGGTATQIAVGERATCALLTSGTLRCWGRGTNGELGYGNTEDVGDDETPADSGDVDVGGPVAHMDGGGWHTCAALRSGRVRCWGQSSAGLLGYGNGESIGDDEIPATAGDVPTHETAR
jgi:alpha-tubulin suppressor-like RCC1 family protein